MNILENVCLKPEFEDGQVNCYSLDGGDFLNSYYIISHPDTSRLMNCPEVVGYEVYSSLLPATARMMRFLKEQGRITSANILSILRGALNYPMEESCYREGIRVHDISFLSSERVFTNDILTGLEIKYSKLARVPDSTLVIGDIIASGETLEKCLQYVIDNYREHHVKLRNIIVFTIGGMKGIELMERMTQTCRTFWPEFEGFVGVYYGGVFDMYLDHGMTGIQVPYVDFYWGNGIVAPEYRNRTLTRKDAIFEKCTIYDGGARRYEILDHIHEVSEYWEDMLERCDAIDLNALLTEKLGYCAPVPFEEWLKKNHYTALNHGEMLFLYEAEQQFIRKVRESGLDVRTLASRRLAEFRTSLRKYIIE